MPSVRLSTETWLPRPLATRGQPLALRRDRGRFGGAGQRSILESRRPTMLLQHFEQRIWCKRLPKDGLIEVRRGWNSPRERCHHYNGDRLVLVVIAHRTGQLG